MITPGYTSSTRQSKRDGETGNDYYGARYYMNVLARFLNADWLSVPEPVPYADFGNPQSLNLYRYPNNPETYPDRDGHEDIDAAQGEPLGKPGNKKGMWSQRQAKVQGIGQLQKKQSCYRLVKSAEMLAII